MSPRRQLRHTTRRRPWTVGVLVSLLALSLLVAACGRRDEKPLFAMGTDDVTLQGQAILVCSEECRGSAQCGALGRGWAVLASSSGPATEAHNLTFMANTTVNIVTNQMVVVQSVADPNRSQRVPFYNVQMPDLTTGWVAGWCIGQPVVP